ncbi:fatty acid desaturase [Myxococcus stipitatus DSM 14675]|uniref:Fatty acid desaturase n=1 Tax=Myxococcus stipitatus (strain DSM 14675 / JCM 12634 / Mx s8) TaxID=1278073 RepID=L7UEV4_MYXSD|nr:fatty acid desaturase family protein [Myxococcus stipitatus]AGC47426.1 fatty acid desaturase [Myxococcus stipitatus DSM 14675]
MMNEPRQRTGESSVPGVPRGQEVWELREFLAAQGGGADTLEALQVARPVRALLEIAETWALILGAWALCIYVSWLLLPVALVIIGSRQRALGNRLHDAAHGNIFHGRALNQRAGALLCGLALFEDFELYRSEHLRHHAYLGHPEKDPDYLEVPAGDGRRHTTWSLYVFYARDARLWRASLLATLLRAPVAHRWRVALWWAVVLGMFSWLGGAWAALSFALLWLISKMTVYHLIKVFAEISDHIGLPPGTVLGYTRNHPSNVLSFFLHPHHDNYHVTHHLFPRVPLANLSRMHELLLPAPAYAQAHHCESYFWGPRSLVKSWLHFQAGPGPDATRS